MVIYAESSFLFSLYGNDAHSEKATDWIKTITSPLSVTELTLFEVENALRFSAARGFIPVSQRNQSLGLIEEALNAGRINSVVTNLANIIANARRLSARHTPKEAHRAFDILHVATALELGAGRFLTFDQNQRKLALAEGLIAPL